jgi:nitric oxide reductase subunit B
VAFERQAAGTRRTRPFGVYGLLGLGLLLFCMRGLTDPHTWNEKLLSISFWCLNIGLFMTTFLSLLPQGLWQTYVSFSDITPPRARPN